MLPNSQPRCHEVDVIRMTALIGICVVNVQFTGMLIHKLFESPEKTYDLIATLLVSFLFEMKFFLLFSFIFGWGMAIQAHSAQAKGQTFKWRYFRRMAGLALIGVLHAIFVFSGDILVLYALLGYLLWLAQDLPTPKLLKLAGWMIPFSMLSLMIFSVMDFIAMDSSWEHLLQENGDFSGSFLENTTTRLADWPTVFIFMLLAQGPLVFAAFLMGLAAAKSNFFAADSAGFNKLRHRLPLLLLIGLPLNVLYAAFMSDLIPSSLVWLELFIHFFINIGAPALSLVYLYLLIQLARKIQLPHLLVLAGQNSLSVYVLQGVLAGFVFGGYGLGLFGELGQTALLFVALGIALSAMLLVGVYAKAFGRGPLEPILRWITGS